MRVLRLWRNIPSILGLLLKRSTPVKVKGLIILALLYLLIPYDLIPEWFPGFGVLDDVVVVTTLLNWAAQIAGHFED